MDRRHFLGLSLISTSAILLPFASYGSAAPSTGALPSPIRTISVSNMDRLRSALVNSRPGDHIIVADGTYNGSSITMNGSGRVDAPIVLRAKNPLKAKLRFRLTVNGSFNIISGVHIEGYGVILSGNKNRITRCKLSDNPGIGIQCKNGTDGVIDHCDLSTRPFTTGIDSAGERRNAILVSSRPGEKFYGCVISRNWVHDLGAKPTDDYDSGGTHAVALGETAKWGDEKLRTIVEDNLIEKCMAGHGILEPKTPGNILRRNTMLNCPKGRMINRQGWDNLWEENWVENCGGMDLFSRVIARRNKIVGGGRLNVGAGNVEWDVTNAKLKSGDPYQRSNGVVLDSNEGGLLVGLRYSSHSLTALNTKILNHIGSIQYAFQNGASSSKKSASSGSPARKLSREEVGPFSV